MSGMTFTNVINAAIKSLMASGLELPMTLAIIPNSESAAVLRVLEDGSTKVLCSSPPTPTAPDAKYQFLALDRNGKAGAKTFDLTPEVQEALAMTVAMLKTPNVPVA
jgi:hypothetical protein